MFLVNNIEIEMVILNIDLSNINLCDTNYDKDDPDAMSDLLFV